MGESRILRPMEGMSSLGDSARLALIRSWRASAILAVTSERRSAGAFSLISLTRSCVVAAMGSNAVDPSPVTDITRNRAPDVSSSCFSSSTSSSRQPVSPAALRRARPSVIRRWRGSMAGKLFGAGLQ
jgi:hypothetical protein